MYGKTGDARAKTLAERAYRLDPEDGVVLDTYGWLLFEEGHFEQAAPLITKARELLPDNLVVRYHYAAMAAEKGQSDVARAELRHVLDGADTFEERAHAQALLEQLSGAD